MSNDKIVKQLIEKHGLHKTFMFCEMMIDMSAIIHEDNLVRNSEKLPLESEYELFWWDRKCAELRRIYLQNK